MNERTKKLAEQAGCFQGMWTTELIGGEVELERFAELVRQDEREACLVIVETHPTVREMSIAIRARSKHD